MHPSAPCRDHTNSWLRNLCRLNVITTICCLALFTSGCASFSASALPDTQINLLKPLKHGSLTIAVRLPENAADVERYYGLNLLESRIIPVEVHATTLAGGNSSVSYHLRPNDTKLSYELTSQGEFTRLSASEVCERVYYSQWASLPAWLTIIMGPFASSSISTANADMLRNYGDKEFKSELRLFAQSPSRHIMTLFFLCDQDIDLETLSNRGGQFSFSIREIEKDTELKHNKTITFGSN